MVDAYPPHLLPLVLCACGSSPFFFFQLAPSNHTFTPPIEKGSAKAGPTLLRIHFPAPSLSSSHPHSCPLLVLPSLPLRVSSICVEAPLPLVLFNFPLFMATLCHLQMLLFLVLFTLSGSQTFVPDGRLVSDGGCPLSETPS